MGSDIHEIQIMQTRGHWEVYINNKFFCTAANYPEAVDEITAYNCNKKEKKLWITVIIPT